MISSEKMTMAKVALAVFLGSLPLGASFLGGTVAWMRDVEKAQIESRLKISVIESDILRRDQNAARDRAEILDQLRSINVKVETLQSQRFK